MTVRGTYEEATTRIKKVLEDLVAGKPFHVEGVTDATNLIYEKMDDNELIVKFLHEVHRTDEYTYRHCVETAFYAMLIAKWLQMDEPEIKKAIQAGLLHDIGKTKIPSEILNKEGIITKNEYEVIKQHPMIGYEMLSRFGQEIDSEVKNAVLHHHERNDRSGYPQRASREEINIYAKIIAVTDVFNAMTTDRVYKKRVSPFDAFEMYQTIGLSLFDFEVMNVFIKNIAPYFIGTKVSLSNGEFGEIVYIPPHDVTHPVVKIKSGYIDLSNKKEFKIGYLITF